MCFYSATSFVMHPMPVKGNGCVSCERLNVILPVRKNDDFLVTVTTHKQAAETDINVKT